MAKRICKSLQPSQLDSTVTIIGLVLPVIGKGLKFAFEDERSRIFVDFKS